MIDCTSVYWIFLRPCDRERCSCRMRVLCDGYMLHSVLQNMTSHRPVCAPCRTSLCQETEETSGIIYTCKYCPEWKVFHESCILLSMNVWCILFSQWCTHFFMRAHTHTYTHTHTQCNESLNIYHTHSLSLFLFDFVIFWYTNTNSAKTTEWKKYGFATIVINYTNGHSSSSTAAAGSPQKDLLLHTPSPCTSPLTQKVWFNQSKSFFVAFFLLPPLYFPLYFVIFIATTYLECVLPTLSIYTSIEIIIFCC
jgi:hypothetical protein